MTNKRIQIEEVLVYLGVSDGGFIASLRREGLFQVDELDPDEAEELRVAHILTDELGVNAAGVDVALHLRRRLIALEHRARAMAAAVERQSANQDPDSETDQG